MLMQFLQRLKEFEPNAPYTNFKHAMSRDRAFQIQARNEIEEFSLQTTQTHTVYEEKLCMDFTIIYINRCRNGVLELVAVDTL